MPVVSIRSILDGQHTGKSVTIRGWIYRKRESKSIIFLVVRDASGIIQCTLKRGSPSWAVAEKLTVESSVKLDGDVKQDKRAPMGYEISVDHLSIIGLAETFPITKDKSEEFLRDVRHLWLRSQKMNRIMKVRSKVLKSTHDFFRKEGFFEVSPPMFISGACEGGATLFTLEYFGKNLYLTQSAQLYLEALIYSLEKVYCVAPSFRAEKSRTIRHLSEYWHVEPEWAFADMDDLMKLEENLVVHICNGTAENSRNEIERLGADLSKLESVKTPFPKITYKEALERLNSEGFEIEWGKDLGFNEEKALAEEIGGPFFVYAYPSQTKAFYCKTYRDNPDLVMSTDMLVPNIGEISTGGCREDDKEYLVRRMKDFGLNQEDYKWYTDLRRYGSVPHVGFGLGVERLLTWMLDLENIMDTIPFPRTVRRFYP
ncbi:asparagine--tRNA ligase [Candidatus Bathyarchaeota archaeon]|nr:asparagine--tRNA ligase [Candidatus Bathyarchaeota archaeon]